MSIGKGVFMENKLTKEEVLHVAHLARIGLKEEEIEEYQVSLKKMIDEIDKIKDLNDFDDDMMISPCNNIIDLNKREEIQVANNELLKNVPNKKGNFIEVPVIINE